MNARLLRALELALGETTTVRRGPLGPGLQLRRFRKGVIVRDVHSRR